MPKQHVNSLFSQVKTQWKNNEKIRLMTMTISENGNQIGKTSLWDRVFPSDRKRMEIANKITAGGIK